ncbi:AMSH-like ubiquitin thioesterase 2 isoform X2 [Diospyros lotus]|uniref:AMSH-like ubiquitin thioesterase 2 isoform X2 n=1 Tax=Diospyros lotus TaxID=55363 RepID=UPI00225525BA|nr:AMSH-like ubiquitin thioesterase 2 isoform X2 [Diospyros lotus]
MPASSYLQMHVNAVTQSFPSSSISGIHNLPHDAEVSRITSADSVHGHSNSLSDGSAVSRVIKDVHISAQLIEDFLALARDNTNNDLETCGVIGAFLRGGTFYVTTLIIPKQESTSSSCQALNEEDIFAILSEQSLFPLGWIHIMVPEAVAIVMAPTDKSRGYGIFRLTDPGGMDILKECQEKEFHSHREPAGGRPLYEHCSHVFVNPNLILEIFDLR